MSEELSESGAKSVAVVNTSSNRYTNASSNQSMQVGCCCISNGCRWLCRTICASRLWHSVWGRVRRVQPYVQKQAVAVATRYHSRRCPCPCGRNSNSILNPNLNLSLSLPRAVLIGALVVWLAFAALYLLLLVAYMGRASPKRYLVKDAFYLQEFMDEYEHEDTSNLAGVLFFAKAQFALIVAELLGAAVVVLALLKRWPLMYICAYEQYM